MNSTDKLRELVQMLKAEGVLSYSGAGCEITFDPRAMPFKTEVHVVMAKSDEDEPDPAEEHEQELQEEADSIPLDPRLARLNKNYFNPALGFKFGEKPRVG